MTTPHGDQMPLASPTDDAGGQEVFPILELPTPIVIEILYLIPDTAGDLLRLCGVCKASRRELGTPSARNKGGRAWRNLFDNLDPCATLLHLDAPMHSCDGYIEHALRLCGADGQQPGWLKLAHRLADNKCTRCGDVTRFVAWQAERGAALRRRCRSCPFSARRGPKIEAVVINELFFDPEPAYHIDASVNARQACLALQGAVFDATDGDTISLRGTVDFDALDTGDPHGAFSVGAAAIRIVGLPRWPSLDKKPFSGIKVRATVSSCTDLVACWRT